MPGDGDQLKFYTTAIKLVYSTQFSSQVEEKTHDHETDKRHTNQITNYN